MLSFPNVLGVTHSFITINGTQLHIAESGKGKPLLLLHGWPQHWYVWRKLVPVLSKHYHLIMPDLPGLGWSEMPKEKDFRKETLAKDILQLIDIMELKRVGLIGHDWGGWIGFLMCQKEPLRFAAYMALGIGYPFNPNPVSPLQMWRFFYQLPLATPLVGEMLLQTMPQITAWGIRQCAYKKNSWTKEDLSIFSSVLQNAKKAQASSLLYRTFLMNEIKQLASYKNLQLQVSSHLLIGENDPIINPSLFQNFKQIENVHIEVIKNCGHFIPEEQPDKVIEAVMKLFK